MIFTLLQTDGGKVCHASCSWQWHWTSVSKVARPPDQSLVEYASDVLLCWQTCPLVGFKMWWLFKQAYINHHKYLHRTGNFYEQPVLLSGWNFGWFDTLHWTLLLWVKMWCTPTKQGTSDILGKISFWYHCKGHTVSFNLIPNQVHTGAGFFL